MESFSAVVTTGIYCRPGCSARPNPANVRRFDLAAAAEAEGYRACLRCGPYRSPPSIGWSGPELVCRAVQMILDGALDGGTEADLDARLSGMGIPEAQADALKRFARAVDGGTIRLDGSVTLDHLVSSISALEDVGPSTAHYVALRLGERDAWPADDPELQRSVKRVAAGIQPTINNLAKDWSPWRAIAAVHLWLADTSAPPWKTAPAGLR